MSTVVVSNIHFESTGNNRIQVEGSNVSVYQAGELMLTANATEMTLGYGSNNVPLVSYAANIQSQANVNAKYRIGDVIPQYTGISYITPPTGFIEFNDDMLLSKTTYPSLFAKVGDGEYTNVSAWYPRSRANTNDMFGSTHGNDIFVIAGVSGAIQTSTDGITWTNRTRANTNLVYDVAYGNGVYVTVGASGAITSSTNGIAWTNRTSFTSVNLKGVTYGNGIFVAVGGALSSSIIRTSTDGTTWANQTPAVTRDFNDVAYGNGVYVAVGQGTNGAAARSTNGTTWTDVTPSDNLPGISVAYGNGLFVAVGGDTFESFIQTSTNGSSWTKRTPATSAETLYGITYGEGFFVVAGEFGSNGSIQVSTNGIAWSLVATTPGRVMYHAAYGANTFLVTGQTSNTYTTIAKASEFKIKSPYPHSNTYSRNLVKAT